MTLKTMNEEYGDGSDHECCVECGLCITCGDCKCQKEICPECKKEMQRIGRCWYCRNCEIRIQEKIIAQIVIDTNENGQTKQKNKMINEYICKKCGCKFRRLDYTNEADLFKAMIEHSKTKHGLNRWSNLDWNINKV